MCRYQRRTIPTHEAEALVGSVTSGTGVGVGFGFNQPLNSTIAEVQDNATIVSATHVNVLADATHDIDTIAESGAASGGTGVVVTVALTVPRRGERLNETISRLGTNSDLTLSGDLTVETNHMAMMDTLADGVAAGSVAVGATLALTAGMDHASATTHSNVDAGGDMNVKFILRDLQCDRQHGHGGWRAGKWRSGRPSQQSA